MEEGERWGSDEKGRGDRESEAVSESVQQPNPEDHVNTLHFNYRFK